MRLCARALILFFAAGALARAGAASSIRQADIAQLRAQVNGARAAAGLPDYGWTEVVAADSSPIRAAQIIELRKAIADVYASAQIAPPSWTDDPLIPGRTPIRRTHIAELTAAAQNAPALPACGTAGQACCLSRVPSCDGSLVCSNSTCQTCGGQGQPCCPSPAPNCGSKLICWGGACRSCPAGTFYARADNSATEYFRDGNIVVLSCPGRTLVNNSNTPNACEFAAGPSPCAGVLNAEQGSGTLCYPKGLPMSPTWNYWWIISNGTLTRQCGYKWPSNIGFAPGCSTGRPACQGPGWPLVIAHGCCS